MIEYVNGRYKTIIEAPVFATKGDEIKSLLAGLSDKERKALDEILALSIKSGGKNIFGDNEFKELPVDLHTFVTNEYYLGKTCSNLYPRWEEDIRNIFTHGFSTIIFTGSIGCGKSFAASVAVLRVLYEISLLKDPHKTFNIAPGSNISIVVFSVTEVLAQKVAYENITTKLTMSQYFKEKFPYEINKKEIRFPNSVWLAPRASKGDSALGLNVIAAFVDEANFLKKASGKGEDDEGMAETLYNQIWRRIESRFKNKGKNPGKLFIVSSKTGHDSFSDTLIRKNMDNPKFWVSDYPTWGVKSAETYSKERFYVMVGTESAPSKILTDKEVAAWKDGSWIPPENTVIDDVPMDYIEDYKRDLEKCIQDMSGLATVSTAPFLQQREKIREVIDLYKKQYPGMYHPFTVDEYVPGKPGAMVWDHITKVRQEGPHKYSKPIINPTAMRHIHIDPSYKGDSTGFCMAHISDWTMVTRRSSDGKEFTERAPVFTVDFMLRITPPTGGELLLSDLRELVYAFSAMGYIITKVTLDSPYAIDSIQQLRAKGYESDKLSVDITMDPYMYLKTAIYEGRVLMYEYAPVIEELIKLEKTNKQKIDHPPKGRKDVSDALAGCIWSLSQTPSFIPAPFLKGNQIIGLSVDPKPEEPSRDEFGDVWTPFIIK